jgi:ketosteroid isomerase-like protein
MAVSCALVLCASDGRGADEEAQAAVRKHADQYIAAMLQRDKVALQALLHERYEGRSLPGLGRVEKGDKARAIAHWTNPAMTFTRLAAKVESVRLFGDTAIETGTLSAQLKDYGTDSTWNKVAYTRVWVREGKGWRLVHEQF